jgi:hypothetical protein
VTPTAARPPRALQASTGCPHCLAGDTPTAIGSVRRHLVGDPLSPGGMSYRLCLTDLADCPPVPSWGVSRDERALRVAGTALGIVIFLACASCVVML